MSNDIVKIQKCNISEALLRNINDNFLNVSFSLSNDDIFIFVKFILVEYSNREKEYIDDFSAELEALQVGDVVKRIEVSTNQNSLPLFYTVYSKG